MSGKKTLAGLILIALVAVVVMDSLSSFRQTPIDDTVPDQAVPNQVAPNQIVSNQIVPSQIAPDQVSPNQAVPDQTVPSQIVSDQVVPNQIVPNQTVPDQVTPNQIVPTQVVPNQVASTPIVPVNAVVPKDHLTLVMISDDAPNGYCQGNKVYVDFNRGNLTFVLSDKYGTFRGSYIYTELNGKPNGLVIGFASYPAWTIKFNPDGSSFTGKEAGYDDSGTYQWVE